MSPSRRHRRLRALIFASLACALAMSVSPAKATQDGVPPADTPRRVRVPPQLSDVLTHSPLASCPAGVASGSSLPSTRLGAALSPSKGRKSGHSTRSRIVTWNIRAARSAPLDAIASELTAMQADLIALQEVDMRMRRTDFVDEPATLAAALGFHYAFAASIKWDEGDYGLAVLSRWPLIEVRRHRLDSTIAGEPRIVLEVAVCADGRPFRLFNHHADVRVASRETGFAELKQIVQSHVGRGIVVLGDFNERADAPALRSLLDTGLVDLGAGRDDAHTADNLRIDYLLADTLLARPAASARVWTTSKSDHHAVLADLEW